MTARRAGAAAALAAFAWWATSLRPFSTAATIAVVGAGVLAIAWGARRSRPHHESPRRRGLAVWTLLAVAMAGWQLAAYLQHPRSVHPTLSSIANGALDGHAVRALGFVIWMALAAVLARR